MAAPGAEKLLEINFCSKGVDKIKPYEELFGRNIITPRCYKEKEDYLERQKAYDEWYKKARCICDCGSEVSLKSHGEHKKSKKHKDTVNAKQHQTHNAAQSNAYKEQYRRTITTPRYYLETDEHGMPKMSYDEWYNKAKCVCECGSVIQARQILQHRKTKKHKDCMDTNQLVGSWSYH
jgi:hypothetical protein